MTKRPHTAKASVAQRLAVFEAADAYLYECAYWAQEGVGSSWEGCQKLAMSLLAVAHEWSIPATKLAFARKLAKGEQPDMG